MLALDGRNQSNQAPSVHQEKTPRASILPEAKLDFLSCQDLMNFIWLHFDCFNIDWVYSFRHSVEYIFLHDWFEGSPPRAKFRCNETNWLFCFFSFTWKLYNDVICGVERFIKKCFWMVTVVVDKWEERLRQDIVWYKRLIALIFDIHFKKRSFDIIYFIIRNWVAKTIEEVKHGSRSCFSLSVYAKLNVFDRFRFSVAHTFHLSFAHTTQVIFCPNALDSLSTVW